MQTNTNYLQVTDIKSIRDDRVLFANINFELWPNQLLQIDGPNGSGKTTLLRILCGLFLQEQGEVLWKGKNIRQDRMDFQSDLIYLGHGQGIKGDFTPTENLRFVRSLYGSQRDSSLQDILSEVGLAGFEHVPSRTLSAGQRRRVSLGKLLLTSARLWILDEPFTSLDKQGQQMVEDLLNKHITNGGIVIITTHQRINISSVETRVLSLGQRVSQVS